MKCECGVKARERESEREKERERGWERKTKDKGDTERIYGAQLTNEISSKFSCALRHFPSHHIHGLLLDRQQHLLFGALLHLIVELWPELLEGGSEKTTEQHCGHCANVNSHSSIAHSLDEERDFVGSRNTIIGFLRNK